MKKVPIVALCGFLGSGKTTLLRRWRRDEALRDTALIIHDLSDLGVDAELLSEDDKSPEAGRLGGRVAALHGKHAGKELHQSLKATLSEVFELKPPPQCSPKVLERLDHGHSLRLLPKTIDIS